MAGIQIFNSNKPRLYFHHTVDYRPKEQNFQMHIHDIYEIFMLFSGRVEYFVEGSVYSLSPGDIIIVRPMESHHVRILSSDLPYDRCCINFGEECLRSLDPTLRLLKAFNSRPLGQNCFFSHSESMLIPSFSIFNAICEEASNQDCDANSILMYLFPLLNELRLAFEKRSEEENARSTAREKLVDYVNRHLFEDISVEMVSEHFYMSSSQTSRLFKKATGSSLWNYVLLKRLTEARGLIRSGVFARVAAERVGFKDYSVFYRAYRKQFGVSPQNDDFSVR